jgi:hypothetical protein
LLVTGGKRDEPDRIFPQSLAALSGSHLDTAALQVLWWYSKLSTEQVFL